MPRSADHLAPAVAVRGLTKRYGTATVVDGIDLEIPPGRLTALVGPNGCGKTTTMAMLLGLVRPSAGHVEVLGQAPRAVSPTRIGALINSPAFYPHLSGLANLQVLARLAGLPDDRVREVLELVGLAAAATQRVARYSLGMKQRLGLAAALLTEPDLLVLDEPGNGLDPVGMQELRTLLRAYVDSGRTVLVSSHALADLDDISDHVVLMHRGRVFRQGDRAALGADGVGEVLVSVASAEVSALLDVLAGAGFSARPDGRYVRVVAGPEQASELNRLAVAAGLAVAEVRIERVSLGSMFHEMVEEVTR